MPVSLVAHIPYQLIVRCIEDIMQRHTQFYNTQARSKMASMYTYHIDNILAQFVAHLVQLLFIYSFKIIRVIDVS